MPPKGTRCCTSCGQASENTFRIVNAETKRAYYYCIRCAQAYVSVCTHCTRVHSSSVVVLHPAPARVINWLRVHAARLRPASVPDWVHEYIMSVNLNLCICTDCRHAARAPCGNCGGWTWHVDIQRVQMQDSVLLCCAGCSRSMLPCESCGVVCSGQGAVSVNSFFRDEVGRACAKCRKDGVPGTSFKVNKSKRLVSLEFEMMMPSPPEGHIKELSRFGIVKGDGSLLRLDNDPVRNNMPVRGWELNTYPSSGDQLLERIQKICNILKRYGAYMNRTCALHNHYDMRISNPVQMKNIQHWWYVFEPIFYAICDKSRSNNSYCVRGCGTAHYNALNVGAYDKHRTFEVRIHHGSLDQDDICGWVLTQLAFFDVFQDKTMTMRSAELQAMNMRDRMLFFLKETKLPLGLRKYIVRAMEKHLGQKETERILALKNKGVAKYGEKNPLQATLPDEIRQGELMRRGLIPPPVTHVVVNDMLRMIQSTGTQLRRED